MPTPALALSILGHELNAVAFRRSAVAGRWECPQGWGETDDLGRILEQAVVQLEPEGRDVAIVLAHPKLTDQVVEVPPAKGWALDRLIERQAQSSKPFPGAPVWSWQPALPTKKTNGALLHLLPRATLEELRHACERQHLHLVRVLPTSAVLISQLKALPLDREEVALVVARTGQSTTIVIGRKDGKVALGRILASSWATAADRVWVDLTRSIGFAEQQCGVTVGSVWLFGAGAEAHLQTAQSVLKVPVRLSPVEATPFYWAEQAAALSEKGDGNLVSLADREAPQRRRLFTATILILGLLLVLSLGATGAIELVRHIELRSVREIDRLIVKLQERKTEWEKKYSSAARKKELSHIVSDQILPPVPAWFLAYLGEVVPDDLVLTGLRVLRTNNAWSVHIAGNLPAPTEDGPVSDGAASFAGLTNRLMAGPFHLQITNSTLGSLPNVAPAGGATSGQPARGAAATEVGNAPEPFIIEGIIP